MLFLMIVLSLSLVGVVHADLSGVNQILLGDDNERASNPEADDVEDRVAEVTTSIALQNTFNETIGNLTVQIIPASGFPITKTQLVVTSLPSSINAGDTINVIINGVLPADLDAVDSRKLDESAFEVATLTFSGDTSNGTFTKTVTVEMQRENQLEIDDVDVCVNSQCVGVDDGDDVENIRPGDRIEFTFTVENKFSDSDAEDLDIEDVELEWEIDDDDLDEDDDEDLGDLSADDQEEESFAFTIDDDVSAGSYTVTARVFGRDENGALHGQEIEFDLDVERDRHDITLRRVTVSPSVLSCVGTGVVTFNVAYVNIGRDDEDDTLISVENDALGITEQVGPLQLDEDDSRQDSIRITIPDDAEPGAYIFKVKSFHTGSVQSDEEQLSVTVPDCSDDDDDTTTPVIVQPPVVVQPPQPLAPQPATVNRRVTQDDELGIVYVIGLVLGVVILLALLILVAVKVFKPRD